MIKESSLILLSYCFSITSWFLFDVRDQDEYEEYEYEDDQQENKQDEEEDPKVIKELINLIKKAGE